MRRWVWLVVANGWENWKWRSGASVCLNAGSREWVNRGRGADHSLWSVWLRRVLLLIFEAVPSEIWSWPKIKSTAWQYENKAGSKQTAGHITNSTSSNDHLVEIGLFTKVNLSNYCVINDKHTWALDCLAFQFNFSQVEECSSWYQTQTKSEGAAGVEECCMGVCYKSENVVE